MIVFSDKIDKQFQLLNIEIGIYLQNSNFYVFISLEKLITEIACKSSNLEILFFSGKIHDHYVSDEKLAWSNIIIFF